MERVQIQFTPEQIGRLKAMASSRGVSVSRVVRDAVDGAVSYAPDREHRRQRALSVVGRFSSGRSDGAADHDRYLAEAYDD